MNCVRVLHVVPALNAAGIESFIMNTYRDVDKERVQFDFYVTRNQSEHYENEINQLGGFVYKSNRSWFSLFRFLKENKYNIVHVHGTTPIQEIYLCIAFLAGVRVRIMHAHSAFVPGKSSIKYFVYNLCKLFSIFANYLFACSATSAVWLYPKWRLKKVKIIPNGINTKKYSFNINSRLKLRERFKIKNQTVLIQVGRFTEQKNQKFTIQVFNRLQSDKYELFFVGKGETEKLIKKYASISPKKEHIHFLGVRNDIESLLSMSDIYLMPSMYEGLPVAAVEAQCSGARCLLSDRISHEIQLTNNADLLPLDEKCWIDEIESFHGTDNRIMYSSQIFELGFDDSVVAEKLEKFYYEKGKIQC